MQNNEIWKDIPGYENIYQVSTFGNIKSLGNNKSKKEKILKGGINSKGYHTVCFKGVTKQVHQLVANVFLNHVNDGHNKIIDHIDNNRLNNNLNNLRIISQRENTNSSKTNHLFNIKKYNDFYSVSISIYSIESEEKAILIRDELIKLGEKLKK